MYIFSWKRQSSARCVRRVFHSRWRWRWERSGRQTIINTSLRWHCRTTLHKTHNQTHRSIEPSHQRLVIPLDCARRNESHAPIQRYRRHTVTPTCHLPHATKIHSSSWRDMGGADVQERRTPVNCVQPRAQGFFFRGRVGTCRVRDWNLFRGRQRSSGMPAVPP